MNRWWIATCPADFLSLAGVVIAFSIFSAFSAALSVEDGLRAGGLGLRAFESCWGGAWELTVDCEFIVFSDLMASFVENILVSRFVIDGFSGGGTRLDFCGSEGGAANPFAVPLRLSVLGAVMPFCLGYVCGEDSTIDDACDEACDRSGREESLDALTVAMIWEVLVALGTKESERSLAAKAMRVRCDTGRARTLR